MKQVNLTISINTTGTDTVDVDMNAEVENFSEEYDLVWEYREGLQGAWNEVASATQSSSGTFTETTSSLDADKAYQFRVVLTQGDLKLTPNVVSYVTTSELIDYHGYTTPAAIGEGKDVIDLIRAATKWIDEYTETRFLPVQEARYYDGDGSGTLFLDDLVQVISVEIAEDEYAEDTDVLDANEYVLDDNLLILKDMFFYDGYDNQKVEAEYGYSRTPPADVIEACTTLVEQMDSAAAKEIESEDIGDYSVSYAQDKKAYQHVKELLRPYIDLNI